MDEEANITAMVDWDLVSAMPQWMATQVPRFLLIDNIRENEPKREDYGDDIEKQSGVSGDDKENLDNEGINMLYWIHCMKYDQAQLSRIYQTTMSHLCPGWNLEVQESALKVDISDAIQQIEFDWSLSRISR